MLGAGDSFVTPLKPFPAGRRGELRTEPEPSLLCERRARSGPLRESAVAPRCVGVGRTAIPNAGKPTVVHRKKPPCHPQAVPDRDRQEPPRPPRHGRRVCETPPGRRRLAHRPRVPRPGGDVRAAGRRDRTGRCAARSTRSSAPESRSRPGEWIQLSLRSKILRVSIEPHQADCAHSLGPRPSRARRPGSGQVSTTAASDARRTGEGTVQQPRLGLRAKVGRRPDHRVRPTRSGSVAVAKPSGLHRCLCSGGRVAEISRGAGGAGWGSHRARGRRAAQLLGDSAVAAAGQATAHRPPVLHRV